jgi:hypothetical protein
MGEVRLDAVPRRDDADGQLSGEVRFGGIYIWLAVT